MTVKKIKDISGNELGFGNSATVNDQRMMNPDGSSNIRRKGLPFIRWADSYNALITMGWGKFSLLILVSYLLINSLFAFLYMLIGIENLNGTQGTNNVEHFFDAFFFSAQTISTVGYGHISPRGILTSSVAAFESMLGLLAFAVATGLLYGRFSRPTAKIMYSDNVLIAPFQGGRALMFRLANLRSSALIELEIQVLLSINTLSEGRFTRKYYPLTLERTKINLLPLSWTVVHPITEDSPLHHHDAESLKKGSAEFIIILKAFDDTFSQTVHSRTSYTDEQLVWDAKFKPVFAPDDDGIYTIDLSKLNDFEILQA